MITTRNLPKIEPKGRGMPSLVLWLCEPFDLQFSFRVPLAEITRVLGQHGSVVLDLPSETLAEDFVQGFLTWAGRRFSVYFERSLGYAEFSAHSTEHVEALQRILEPHISCEH
jgi:hypothetical protein